LEGAASLGRTGNNGGTCVLPFVADYQTRLSTAQLNIARPAIYVFRAMPATLALLASNLIVFILTWFHAKASGDKTSALTLLEMGAHFSPLTLDEEWYRIFMHTFLHENALRLAVNMYALLAVGSGIEKIAGSKKVLIVYLVSAVASALNTAYWNLFSITTGASGAISGLFGFMLVANIFLPGKSRKRLVKILIHLGIFLTGNLLLTSPVHANMAGDLAGLATGMLIAIQVPATSGGAAFKKVRIEYLFIPVLVAVYFLLPRYQVHYYQFFQKLAAAEDSGNQRLRENLSDPRGIDPFISGANEWDEILAALNKLPELPPQLAADTFRLRRYVHLRKQENIFKKTMLQRESYVYLDSVDLVQKAMNQYRSLDYGFSFSLNKGSTSKDRIPDRMVKAYYDFDWVEVPSPPAPYYRIGCRDSLGRWNGNVVDYYANGNVRTKGSYKQDKRDGIFLSYSDHQTYTSGGRYQEGRSVGKWETFHNNGRLASEVYYNNYYFLKSLWDSLGNQLVVDGNGREVQRHANGLIATEGEYRHGYKEGYWYGYYPNGEMYYEEVFEGGRLVSGKSRSLSGETFMYDGSSLLPMPEGGFEKFQEYVNSETSKRKTDELGHVKISFRVTKGGVLTDVRIDQGASPHLDAKAMEILLNGPPWLPGKMHGHRPVDAPASVTIQFY
jgi:membrane associated rhomboid family serine protease/antitoxin component YwqK of YwqJK toxin-antitoxin module